MREYGPYTYEEIEKELGIKLSDGMNQLEKDTEIQGNQNNLLEEKIKTEVDNTLGMAEEAEGGKKGKKGVLLIKNRLIKRQLQNQKNWIQKKIKN